MMRRWSLHDPEGVLADYTFATSPNQRDDPEMEESLDPLPTGVDGALAAMPVAPSPMEWSFKGICFTLAEVTMFETWLNNGRPIELTDHHNQTWRVQFTNLDSTRKGSRAFPEKQEVTVHCLMFGKV